MDPTSVKQHQFFKCSKRSGSE